MDSRHMPFKNNKSSEGKHSLGKHSLGEVDKLRPFDPDKLVKPNGADAASDSGAHVAAGAPLVDVPVIGADLKEESEASVPEAAVSETKPEQAPAATPEETPQVDAPAADLGATTALDPADLPDVEESELSDSEVIADASAAKEASEEVVEPSSEFSRGAKQYEHRKGTNSVFTKKQKITLVIVAVLAILIAIGAGVGLAWYQNLNKDIHIEDDELEETLQPVEVDEDPFWTLILGSDSRTSDVEGSRSDVIMLVRVDPKNKTAAMISIPRDTQVEIEGYGTQKINAAYALGGASLAVKVVSEYANVDISHYAEVHFSGFEELVDTLGGVTVNVPEYCSYKDVTLQPGKQKINGHQALIFARCRKTYAQGDFTRTKCQRILVKAIVKKVLSMSATEIPQTLAAVSKCVSVDSSWTTTDLANLAIAMKGMKSKNIYSAMAPSDTGMENGASYTFTYTYQWMLMLQRANEGKKPKLDKTEQAILGTSDTRYVPMDWSTGIPQDLLDQIEEHEKEKAEKKAKKAQSTSSESESDSSADDTSGTDSTTSTEDISTETTQ